MTNTAGTPPFNPILEAAVQDVKSYLPELREQQEAAPDKWQALRLRNYWNGDTTVAILKPERVNPIELTVIADGALQEYKGGEGLVAVLVRGGASSLTVTFTTADARIDQTMTIRDLSRG